MPLKDKDLINHKGSCRQWVILLLGIMIQVILANCLFAQTAQDNKSNATSAADGSIQTTDASIGGMKKLSLEQLMDLDVTSVSKQPEPYGEAPAAIQVITNDTIRRSGATSIPEALRSADNLEISQASSASWDISARGFNAGLANKLLVMIDGRSVYTPLDSGVFWNAQDYPLYDLDRIEVVSGPGGTLWGANAVNGVINIISKDAKDTQGLYLKAAGGTWLEDLMSARYGGTLDPNTYYRVYGKYAERGDEVNASGNNLSDSWRMGQGGFRVDSEAGPQEKLTLQGDIYGSTLNLPSGGPENFNGGNILGRWSRSFSADSGLELQLYYDRTNLYDPIAAGSLGAAGTLVDTLDTYDLDFQNHFGLDDRNRLTWGVGCRITHDVVQSAPSTGFTPSILDHGLFSGFVQDEFKPFERWTLTVGTKVEHNDYTGFEYEPSARLAWTPGDKQLLWAAVSRAVRMPSRIDRDFAIPYSGSPLLLGVPSYGSEYVVAYELGYRAQLTREFSTSVSTFFNNYDDLRTFSPTPGTTFPYSFANGLAGQTYGVEVTADVQAAAWWRLHAGYDLLQENLWVKAGQTDADNGQGDTADPQNQAFLRSSMDLPGNLEFDPSFRWVDSLAVLGSGVIGTVPSYAELDARLGWHPVGDIEIAVIGQDLLQDHHPEYGFPSPTREEIVRSVYGEATCQF